eukprot:scaffold111188_cov62-Phaeocystis_antarctica.AAC.3
MPASIVRTVRCCRPRSRPTTPQTCLYCPLNLRPPQHPHLLAVRADQTDSACSLFPALETCNPPIV